jgi:hypothetical protein
MRHPRRPTGQGPFHLRGNGLGNLEMTAVPDFIISSRSVGNDFQKPLGNEGSADLRQPRQPAAL